MSCVIDPIIKALRDDDPQAYEKLYAKYYNMLFYKALITVRDEDVAKDMVQLTLIKFWKKKIYATVHTSLDGLLFAMCHRECQDYLRNEYNRRKRASRYQYTAEHQAYDGEDDYIEHKLAGERYYRAVEEFSETFAELPIQQQKVIANVYLLEKSYVEAAADMSVSIHTMRTHLRRALSFLRQKYGIE